LNEGSFFFFDISEGIYFLHFKNIFKTFARTISHTDFVLFVAEDVGIMDFFGRSQRLVHINAVNTSIQYESMFKYCELRSL